MAAAHAQERAQTVQRSHPARQAGSAPQHPEEGAREILVSLNPSWRKGSCCQSLSPPLPPPLASIPLRKPRESRRGKEKPEWRELPTAPREADWSGTGYERRHRAERLLPSLHLSSAWCMADDNKPREKSTKRKDEPWGLYRAEVSSCRGGSGGKSSGLGSRAPPSHQCSRGSWGRQCV